MDAKHHSELSRRRFHVTAHLANLQRPHGRVHFAGEHTTVLRGTMEGALRSGIRAAEEVHEAAGA